MPPSPLAFFARMLSKRQLLSDLIRRDVVGRYRGSALGLLWSFFSPILMIAVYSFAFRELLGAKWPNQASGPDYTMMIFVGIIVHGLAAECLARAPALITSNPNYVKRVVFPLEILPASIVGSALFHAAVTTLVLLVFLMIAGKTLFATILLAPVIIAPFVVMLLGISWFLSAIGVYLRDVGQVTNVIIAILMFLSPVFYPTSAVPVEYRPLLLLNPLTLVIDQLRAAILFGVNPDWSSLGLYSLVSLGVAWLGFAVFEGVRKGFADVL